MYKCLLFDEGGFRGTKEEGGSTCDSSLIHTLDKTKYFLAEVFKILNFVILKNYSTRPAIKKNKYMVFHRKSIMSEQYLACVVKTPQQYSLSILFFCF